VKTHFKLVVLAVTLLIPALEIASQEREEREHPDPNDIRSFATLFGRLEHDLATAIQARQIPDIEKFLAPEFVMRSASDPQRIVSQKDWIRGETAGPKLDSVEQREMVIRAFMSVAVVSFIQEQQRGAAGAGGDFLVTDIWVANSGKWKLAQRYWASVVANTVKADRK
jgi:hypothetical protein